MKYIVFIYFCDCCTTWVNICTILLLLYVKYRLEVMTFPMTTGQKSNIYAWKLEKLPDLKIETYFLIALNCRQTTEISRSEQKNDHQTAPVQFYGHFFCSDRLNSVHHHLFIWKEGMKSRGSAETRQSLLADEPSTVITMKVLLLLALAARQVNFIEYQIKIQDRCLKGIAPWR